jgi:hypothetical protein
MTRKNNIKTRQSTNHDVYQDTSHHNKHNPAASHTLRPETAQTNLAPATNNEHLAHALHTTKHPQLTRKNNTKTRQSTYHDVYQDTSHQNKHNPAASYTCDLKLHKRTSHLPQTTITWRMHSLPPNTPS